MQQDKEQDLMALVPGRSGAAGPTRRLALQTALVGLTGQSPAILVDGVAVQTIGAVKADKPQRLGVQFNLSVLREQP